VVIPAFFLGSCAEGALDLRLDISVLQPICA
jgi:hypothetical protein